MAFLGPIGYILAGISVPPPVDLFGSCLVGSLKKEASGFRLLVGLLWNHEAGSSSPFAPTTECRQKGRTSWFSWKS